MSDDDLLATIKAWHREALERIQPWREQAREDFAFESGDQWTAEERALLEEQKRPPTVFDRIGPIVAAVVGTEVNNRQELRFLPREPGDAGVNDLLTAAADYVRDNCDAEHEESCAFRDMVICGMGWTESRLDTDVNPDGDIRIERVDPLEMIWDFAARRSNLEDARFVMRAARIARSEAQAMFPDADPGDLDASWAHLPVPEQGRSEAPHERYRNPPSPEEGYGAASDGPHSTAMVTIIQCQWWERETVWMVAGQDGEFAQTEGEYRELAKRWRALMGSDLPARQVTRRRFRQAFVGRTVLEEGDAPVQDRFTFQAMTGKRDHQGLFMGIVRPMKDPQRWSNKFFSQALHIVNTNAKGGLMAETGAFEDVRQAEESWSDPAGITWLRPGGLNQVRDKNPPAFPVQVNNLLQYADATIRDVSGVNLEMLGSAERNQPGILEYQRKQAAVTILAGLFDSLRRYRKAAGRVLLAMIRDYISDGRLIRIQSDGTAQAYLPLVRDAATAEYDVIVDEAPSSPNQKERVFAMLMNGAMAPILQNLPPGGWLALLKYFPLPESVIQELSQVIAEAAQPDPMQQQLAQAKAESEIGKTQAGAALDAARAEGERLDAAKVAQELQMRAMGVIR